jgi:hypothetical protein
MYQVPTPIWNEIAASQPIKHRPWKAIFPLKAEPMMERLNALETRIDAKAKDARVTRGYLLTAPLLMENVAISRFVEAQQAQNLRAALPELTTISEAVDLATKEFSLMPSQQMKLRQLLQQAYNSPPN